MFYVSFDIFAKITKINRVAMSMKDAIRKMREEMEKQGGRREKLNNAIKKEINETNPKMNSKHLTWGKMSAWIDLKKNARLQKKNKKKTKRICMKLLLRF